MSSASDFAKAFGGLIERYIDDQGLSRKEVAARVWGEPDRAGHVTAYINGRRGKPGAPIIKAFCDALNIPAEEIQALRTQERAAAEEEAKALNIPVAFLDTMATLFGAAEQFQGWDAYADFMAAKAEDYARLKAEVADLGQTQPATANRLPDIRALLDAGDIDAAEQALEDLRATATDKALDGLRDLSRIIALQGDAALLKGDEAEAFALHAQACDLFDPVDPREGAHARYGWAARLWRHGLRFGGGSLAEAAELYRRNIAIWTDADYPAMRAQNQNGLGLALADRGIRTQGAEGAGLLDQAVTVYRAALQVSTRQDQPVDWAMTQNNLGIALQNQATRTQGAEGAALLDQAVTAFRAALEVYTRTDHPVDWAMTQNNLGIALEAQGTRTQGAADTALLDQAVTAYRAALEVYTRQYHPVDWAMTQNNLGNALDEQGTRTQGAEGAALLDQAVTAYRAALEVTTRQDHPVDWAMTQENLAIVFQQMAGRTDGAARADLLTQALAAVDGALEVFDPEAMSYNHDKATRRRESILADMAGD